METVHICRRRHKVRKVKACPESYLVRYVKGSMKCLFKYVGYKRKAGEHMGLQLNGAGAQYLLPVVVLILGVNGVTESLALLLVAKAEGGSIRL